MLYFIYFLINLYLINSQFLCSANHKKKNVRNKPRKKVTTTPSGNRSSNIPIGYENMSNPEVTGNSSNSANESRHPGHGGSVDYSAHLGRANIVVPTTSPSGGLPEASPKYVIYIIKPLINI